MSQDQAQHDLDVDLGIAGLEQTLGDRQQAINDRDQECLDRTQADLDRDVEAGGKHDAGEPDRRRRQSEVELAQVRRTASQDGLDDAQRARDERQQLLDSQQAEIDDPPPAELDPAAARRRRAGEMLGRADAMESRARGVVRHAAKARARARSLLERYPAHCSSPAAGERGAPTSQEPSP